MDKGPLSRGKTIKEIKPAGQGGKRPGAGQKPGAVSKARCDLSKMAKNHAAQALKTGADIARMAQSDAARVAAAVVLLDRAIRQALPHRSRMFRIGSP